MTGTAIITAINRLMLSVEVNKMKNRFMVSKGKQAGFTIIELVMVIVILGILAVFALPRLADLDSSAHSAAVEGVAGSMRTAASMAHSLQLATGVADNATVTIEGTSVQLKNGYPDIASIAMAAGFDPASDYTSTDAGTNPDVRTWTRYDDGSCSFSYTEAASGSSPAVATSCR